jgi:hypothetical protein
VGIFGIGDVVESMLIGGVSVLKVVHHQIAKTWGGTKGGRKAVKEGRTGRGSNVNDIKERELPVYIIHMYT